jgi:hypothetical protein
MPRASLAMPVVTGNPPVYVHFIELVQYRLSQTLLAQDIRLDPPRQIWTSLVFHVGARWNSEDVVKLLEGALLRLWHP